MTAKAKRLARREHRRARRVPYVFIAPAIIILLVGMGYPVLWQLLTSTREFGLAQQFGKPAPFVWFQNYADLLTDSQFWAVVIRSLAFMVLCAVLTLAIGLALAVLMSTAHRFARIVLQVSLLLAWGMPVVASMTVFTWLFDRRRGAVNYLFDKLPGVSLDRYDWLGHPITFFMVAAVAVIWMSVPFVAFAIYAGLMQIPEEVLEAAALDGAGPAQRIGLIALPMIRPVIALVLLLQVIWDLRVFAQIRLLQGVGTNTGDFDLLGTYVYKLGTGSQDFGSASAASVIILIITISISWFYVRIMIREEA